MAPRRIIYPSGLGQNPDGPAPPAPAAGDTEPQSWSPPSPPRSALRRGFSAALLAAVTNFAALEDTAQAPAQDGSEAQVIRSALHPAARRAPGEPAALLEGLTAGQDDLAWAEVSLRPAAHSVARRAPGESGALLEALTAGQDDLAWLDVALRPVSRALLARLRFADVAPLLDDPAAPPTAGDDIFAPAPRIARPARARHVEPGVPFDLLTAGQDDLAWWEFSLRPAPRALPARLRFADVAPLLDLVAPPPTAGDDVFSPAPRIARYARSRHVEPGVAFDPLTAGQDDLAWAAVFARPAPPAARQPGRLGPFVGALLEEFAAAGVDVFAGAPRIARHARGRHVEPDIALEELTAGQDDLAWAEIAQRPARRPLVPLLRFQDVAALLDLPTPPAEPGRIAITQSKATLAPLISGATMTITLSGATLTAAVET